MLSSARLGDHHSCPLPGHGVTPITTASGDVIINFMGAARVGDVCGCGAVITTGFPSIQINGLPMAHLGSPTSHGGTIITGSPDTFGGFTFGGAAIGTIINFAKLGAVRADGAVDEPLMAELLADPQLEQRARLSDALVQGQAQKVQPHVQPEQQQPGFYIVPKSMTVDQVKSTLFGSQTPAVMSKFQALNPDLKEIKAGSMIVLSDPNNLQCTREEALLMEAAAKTNNALKSLSPEEADFMARHRDEIETFLAQGSTAIGIGEVMFAKNLEEVKTILRDIEALHQKTFQANGHLRSPAFFAERKRLLAQLNTNLSFLTRKGIGFPDHPDLKSALGISSRSLVHHWTKAGATGQIPGYATHIDGVSKAAKAVKYGGWIGTAIGGGASYMKVQDVCTAGNAEACQKVKFTETGSFVGGVAGGATAGAFLSAPLVATLCVALGVPTGGMATLACGVVAVGAGSVAAGTLGGLMGELGGEVIYEVVK